MRAGSRFVIGVLLAVAAMVAAPQALAGTVTPLTLANGWQNAPYSTRNAGFEVNSGVVEFEGAIAGGAADGAFTLPVGDRPAGGVYLPADLCNATEGQLMVWGPSGVGFADDVGGNTPYPGAGGFSNAQCFTSLEGASFAPAASGYTPLSPLNGWFAINPFGASAPAARVIGGVVHLRGGIADGESPVVFTLPPGMRPATDVYVPVDVCNTTERLHITPSGTADVEDDSGALANASCFSSLDGATFALSPSGYTPLNLLNGWTNAPFGTSAAAVRIVNGVVQFKGAIAQGTSATVFTLPAGMRPAADVYVPVDLCGATNGRLHITPSGTVDLESEGGNFGNAQCFTSLDGAWFAH